MLNKRYLSIFVVTGTLLLLAACGNDDENAAKQDVNEPLTKELVVEHEEERTGYENVDPHSVEVLVNRDFPLPDDFEPKDLVYPDVPFIFEEKVEKRMLRDVAAEALEEMFEAAEADGIYLAGVSGYRSHARQITVFNQNVQADGEEHAKKYSAPPGTSEHETGLAIDVSGSTAKCAVEDCFADTEESDWLVNNASKYGYIIRYLEGKEEITGYQYEPWHLRYVGKELAMEIDEQGITLEEYYGEE